MKRTPRGLVPEEPKGPKRKMAFGSSVVCPYCKGKGVKAGRNCAACDGEGFINEGSGHHPAV